MSGMVSQITSLTIVYSTVYSSRRSKKTPKLRVTGLCEGNSPVTGEFPAQRACNAENVSIWWRHHVDRWPHPVLHMNPTNYIDTCFTLGHIWRNWDLIHQRFLRHNSNSMKTSIPNCKKITITKFCTCHGSCAAGYGRKYSDPTAENGIMTP